MLPHKPNPKEGRLSKKIHRLEHGTSGGVRLNLAPSGSDVDDKVVPTEARFSLREPPTKTTLSPQRYRAPALGGSTGGMTLLLSMQYRTTASSAFTAQPALPASKSNEEALRQFRAAHGQAVGGGGAGGFSAWKHQQSAWEQAGKGYGLTAPTTQGKSKPLRSEC
jgi:hypothetical protein